MVFFNTTFLVHGWVHGMMQAIRKLLPQRTSTGGVCPAPFHFPLYMEPLLRWLHVGGRGYMHSCIHNQSVADTHPHNNISSAAVSLLHRDQGENEELVRIRRVTSRPLLQTKTSRATGFFKSAS